MKFLTLILATLLSVSAFSKDSVVVIDTNYGDIEIALNTQEAPITVANFLKYVDAGFYDGLIFHRVINNFMIQGGGLNDKMEEKRVNTSIQNEARNGLSNKVGTIAMARTSDPHSARTQFFINVSDNVFLDHRNTTQDGWGYAVFGKVISGMDVVNKIKGVPTTSRLGYQDVPVDPVFIEDIRRK